jgi:hypothetical protein
MSYKHQDKNSGDLIQSADWNKMGHELERLETDKVNRRGDTITGDLKVTSKVGIGNNATPSNPLSVSGGVAVGAGYATNTAPSNGLLVEGHVGIGTDDPQVKLDVRGKLKSENARQIVTAQNEISTTATAWQDMPDMSVNLTTSHNLVLVLFKAGGVQTPKKVHEVQGKFRLLIDGVQKAYTVHGFLEGGWGARDVMLNWMGTLSAENHTIKVQWCVQQQSKTLMASTSDAERSLIAIEL